MLHPRDGRLHFSELKQFRRSPAHYKLSVTQPREVTRAMTVGAVADAMVFGNRGWAMYAGKVRNGKEWIEFASAHEGETICLHSEMIEARGAADAVLANPIALSLLSGCEYQRVMQWDAHGLPCGAGIPGERGGFDAWHEKRSYIIDLKTTASTEPTEFATHAYRMQWHAQAAWYLDGARALALDVRDFYLIGVESSPPHCVTVMKVSDEAIEAGRKSIRLWVEQYKRCAEAGQWPGYTQSIVGMSLPAWAGLEGLED